MQIHRNAKTTPSSRSEIVQRATRGRQAYRQVGRDFGISHTTVRKWVLRWRQEGRPGLSDRRAAPKAIPHKTSPRLERRVAQLRRRRWVAWQIARAIDLAVSTVSAILRRLGLGRLSSLDSQPDPPRRYERTQPGELLHIDTKKLGRIRGIGHRITGKRQPRNRGIGWEYAHVCIDDYTRLAYVEVLPDERKKTCCGFLLRAVRWFHRQRIEPQSLMTDNGSAYNSIAWRELCDRLGVRHLKTRPYTPRTNGKAERFIQTLTRQWAYGAAYRSSERRREALPVWLRYYNTERPHRALGMCPPRQRLRHARKQRT